MSRLAELPNIAKTLEQQLEQAGITTQEQLINTGSKQAWLEIQKFDASACINRLYALEGAIQGVRWHALDQGTKTELKEFYNAHKL